MEEQVDELARKSILSAPSICDGTDPTETELMAKAKPSMRTPPTIRNIVMTAHMRIPSNKPKLDLGRFKYAFSRPRPANEPVPRRLHRSMRTRKHDKKKKKEEKEEKEDVNEDDMLGVGSAASTSDDMMVFRDAFEDYRDVSLIAFTSGALVLTGANSTRTGNICLCRAALKIESMYSEKERALLT